MIWVYLAAMGVAVLLAVGAGVWWWERAERRTFDPEGLTRIFSEQTDARGNKEALVVDEGQSTEEGAALGAQETPVPSNYPEKEFEQSGASLEQPMQLGGASPSRNPDHPRLCPECDRSFPANYVVCPFDSTALETLHCTRGDATSGEPGSGHRRCPTCDRRYFPGQRYCYRDGSELVPEAEDREPETGDDAWRVCPDCGRELQTEARLCPEDGTELIRVGSPRSDHGRTTPPVPVMQCPECGETAPPGSAECPNDGTLLTPIQNESLTEFPPVGLGPRRKLCPECGERYSRAARYCGVDGTELVERN